MSERIDVEDWLDDPVAREIDAMSDEEVCAELIRDGVDVERFLADLDARLLINGAFLPVRSPQRRNES